MAKKLTALQLAAGDASLIDAVKRSKRLLRRRALISGLAGAVPVPGLDWVIDAALLNNLIPRINTEFGLNEQQLTALSPSKRERIQQAVSLVGTMLVGKFITKDLLLRAAKSIGIRLTAQQAVKFVPLAGQAVSAFISYSAIQYLGEQHMRDCVRVLKMSA